MAVGFEWHQLVGVYLPLSIGVAAQVVFLLLPVDLRNWRDDALNAMTYISMQVFMAGVLFMAIPRLYGLFHLDAKGAFTLLLIVAFAAVARTLRIIPLEGTHPVVSLAPAPPLVQFTEFYDKDRLLHLAVLSEADPDDVRRIVAIKERVRKRGREAVRGNLLAAKPGT